MSMADGESGTLIVEVVVSPSVAGPTAAMVVGGGSVSTVMTSSGTRSFASFTLSRNHRYALAPAANSRTTSATDTQSTTRFQRPPDTPSTA